MTESLWESQAVEEPQAVPQVELDQPDHPETAYQELREEPGQRPAAEPETLALSVDDFAALEERVLRAVNLVKRERLARAAAEERAALIEAQLSEQMPHLEHLEKEVSALRAEREHVRQRVERLLAQLDALEI